MFSGCDVKVCGRVMEPERESHCQCYVQVQDERLHPRFGHSSDVISLLTEVTIFGGCAEWPENYKSDADLPQIANTTVLQFGEFVLLYTGTIL